MGSPVPGDAAARPGSRGLAGGGQPGPAGPRAGQTWDGRVAGFEIKAGTRIRDPDLNALRLLRDRLGDRFAGGFVLNLGELAYRKESKIAVMPLSALWSLPARNFS